MTGPADATGWVRITNEFASVLIRVEDSPNGAVLQVADPSTGRTIRLDPLELQALAWCRHDQLGRLLEPAFKEQRLAEDEQLDEAEGAEGKDKGGHRQ